MPSPYAVGTPTLAEKNNGVDTFLTCTTPTGLAVGEVLAAYIIVSGGTTVAPAGFVRDPNASNPGTAVSVYVDYLPIPNAAALAAVTATYTWTGVTVGRMTGVLVRLAAVDFGNPIDACPAIGTTPGGGGSTCAVASQTTLTPGTLQMSVIGGNAAVGLTWTPPAGLALLSQSTNTGRGAAVAIGAGPNPAGATGTETWSWSTTALELRAVTVAWRGLGAWTVRPYSSFQMSFTDPNVDPFVTPPVWVDFTQYFQSATMVGRGRQYELAQTFPATPTATLKDTNEYLNSANPSSPYAPNVKPYRPVLWQGMWPNLGRGNLLNTGAWRGNKLDVVDGSFEAYAAGTTPWWVAAIGNAVPVITTSTPRTGLNSLTYNCTGAGSWGVSLSLATIPGQTYTASVYVRQTAANTLTIRAANPWSGATTTGTNTTTVGAYTRLQITFTPTQDHWNIFINQSGTTASVVNIDDAQVEVGAAASAVTTTGPVIYPVFRGFAERFQKVWQDNGFTGYVKIPLVDGFAALQATRIATEYPAKLDALAPDYYWPLTGGASSVSFSDASGHGNSPLVPFVSKYGAGSGIEPGTPMAIAGDPSATGVSFTSPALPPGTQNAGTILATGALVKSGTFTLPAVIGSSWGLTAAVWVANSPTTPTSQSVVLVAGVPITNTGGGGDLQYPIMITLSTTGQVTASLGCLDPSPAFRTVSVSSAASGYNDGKPHLIVATVTQVSAGNTVITLYVDGNATSNTVTTALLGGMLTASATTAMVGGEFTRTVYDQMLNGPADYVAFWNRALSGSEAAALWSAGGLGFAGETSGARIARHMVNGGLVLYQGAFGNARISTGETTMGPPTYTPAIDLLTDSQNTTVAEQGNLWIAPDGATVFEDRNDRFLRLASIATLGENVSGGETSYLGDIEYDTDPTFVFADVEVTRNGGSTALGGRTADINTAIAAFYNRSFTAGADFQTDAQAQDMADWIFYTHNAATQRINTLTIDPASNPAYWPQVLGREIGQRVTVVRRAKAANGGAGLTITADFFIESVLHDFIDMFTGQWQTTYLLSPVGGGTPQTMQPWILENATYGVLDQTTKLGW